MNALTRHMVLSDTPPLTPTGSQQHIVISQPSSIAPRPSFYARFAKRPLDIALVLLGLPIAVPLIALMALAVALQGGQPFYRQTRVGKGGRTYTMWKLRTMVRGADHALHDHLHQNPQARAEWAAHQKLRDDPRITTVGLVLRKSSLDELPQIWNVLKGEMSLIGPRPMMINQQDLYDNASYFALRPGITGLWQVSRRNEASFFERAQIDAEYAKTVSFLKDAKILMSTLRVVLRGTGY